jgi:hypothetical protein
MIHWQKLQNYKTIVLLSMTVEIAFRLPVSTSNLW